LSFVESVFRKSNLLGPFVHNANRPLSFFNPILNPVVNFILFLALLHLHRISAFLLLQPPLFKLTVYFFITFPSKLLSFRCSFFFLSVDFLDEICSFLLLAPVVRALLIDGSIENRYVPGA
jgi:hypothetical protein